MGQFDLDKQGNIAYPGESALLAADAENAWGNLDGSSFMDRLLGSSQSDGKGGVIKSPGFAGIGLSAFNAWNSWHQGDKIYDLQKDSFDFSKDKFWNNYAQQTDLVNRAKNITNRQIDYKRSTMGMTGAEKNAYYQNQSTDYYKGNQIKEVDGSYSTVGQAIPDKYAGTNTPALGPTVNNAAPVGGPTVANAAQSAMIPAAAPAIAPPGGTRTVAPAQSNLAPKSQFVGEKPKKIGI